MFCDLAVVRVVVFAPSGGRIPKNGGNPASSGLTWYLLGLLPEQRLQLLDLLGVARREVVGLGEVVGQVVELDRVLVGLPDAGRELS